MAISAARSGAEMAMFGVRRGAEMAISAGWVQEPKASRQAGISSRSAHSR